MILFFKQNFSFKRLSDKQTKLWKLIGTKIKYEAAVAQNFYIWIQCNSLEETLLVMNLILAFDELKDEELFIKIFNELYK